MIRVDDSAFRRHRDIYQGGTSYAIRSAWSRGIQTGIGTPASGRALRSLPPLTATASTKDVAAMVDRLGACGDRTRFGRPVGKSRPTATDEADRAADGERG